MLYELRIYESVPGRLPDLLKRFEAVVLGLWAKHGITPVGFWTSVIGQSTNVTLHYMLSWSSLAEREQKMAAFAADPDWVAARDKSEVNGPYVARVSSTILTPTSFSQIK